MEGPTWVSVELGAHLRMFVGGVIAEHDMDRLVGRHLPVDGIDEPDELLVPMALPVLADDCLGGHLPF